MKPQATRCKRKPQDARSRPLGLLTRVGDGDGHGGGWVLAGALAGEALAVAVGDVIVNTGD